MSVSNESTDMSVSPTDDSIRPLRPRSDSLDIFTMSPLGSPSLDTFPISQDNANMRLPDPPTLDLGQSISFPKRDIYNNASPPSTPNSPLSFSFSAPYAGTSYGTDMTSLIGSWGPGAAADRLTTPENEEHSPARDIKGKAVQREHLAELDVAPNVITTSQNGKGKAREIQPKSFELDFESQQASRTSLIDFNEGPCDPPVVRLSPVSHQRQRSHGRQESVAGCSSRPGSTPEHSGASSPYPAGPSHRPPSPQSSPSPLPSSEVLSCEETMGRPAHRRSLSSLSIRSIRSSSSRSMASIRSAVSRVTDIRGRVKSMTPAAKKLKVGLRKVFKRKDGRRVHDGVDSEDDGNDTDDEDAGDVNDTSEEIDALSDAAERPAGHGLEASVESYMTLKPATSGVMPVEEAIVEDGNCVPASKPRSRSAPLPFSTQTPPSEKEPEAEAGAVDIHVEAGGEETVKTVETTPNRFNDWLPQELQLAVLQMLVKLHETEYESLQHDDRSSALWTARVAGRTRWVGREKGVRELIKLTRVSKTWQRLALDGQLWSALHLVSSPPHLSLALLLRIAEHARSFVRSLNLHGWTQLDPATLRALVRFLSDDASPHHLAPTPPFPPTNLTHVTLRRCLSLTQHSLHHLLLRAPMLRSVDLRGLAAVTNTTCGVLAAYCSRLESADLRRCSNMDAMGVVDLVGGGRAHAWWNVEDLFGGATGQGVQSSKLRVLRVSGLLHMNTDVMTALAQGAPDLEVLDLSGSKDLTDEAVAALVAWDTRWDDDVSERTDRLADRVKVELSAREMGLDPMVDHGPFFKRVTRLRHLNLSGCLLLTDAACTHLAHCVPKLELLELAGIGPDLKDDGLIRLLHTTPKIRRLDLEDACDVTDDVLVALTPTEMHGPGHALEHLVLSYAQSVTNEGLLAFMRGCPRLVALECDNTRISGLVVREFVKLARERGIRGAELVAVDCRAITETLIRDLACGGQTRARKGYRHHDARTLGYVDRRDGEFLGSGSGIDVDDCDETRVAIKSFWSWQGVDAVRREREKRRKLALSARRNTDAGESLRRLGLAATAAADEDDEFLAGGASSSSSSSIRPRWLGHWTRTSGSGSGSSSPTAAGFGSEDDRGCSIM